ncbi:ubiquinone/menaquinone biosynthesis C-methyltransferase UbiE [bacterium MnTg02]|nr:ubiquinone/menaquinone biosynthesis C-methyltransferase UbiE [bacterium MnTg02]
MYPDVTELRDFYGTAMGTVVRRLIASRLRARWRNVQGLNVFGLGYPGPYLGAFRGEAARIGALMPAKQGIIAWPGEGPRQCALVDDTDLPLPDASADRILIVHGLEHCEASHRLLREVWRVLTPNGRVLLIVPNRRGVWARLDSTPFGHGRPYSRGQLDRNLQNAMFRPVDWIQALFMPPINRSLLFRSATAWERLGARLWPAFSGLILVEAVKEVYATTPKSALRSATQRLRPLPATLFAGSGDPSRSRAERSF